MLSSGGEPLQLTSDGGDKIVSSFSTDGTEIYYGRFLGKSEGWSVPTLGGKPTRVVSGAGWGVPTLGGKPTRVVLATTWLPPQMARPSSTQSRVPSFERTDPDWVRKKSFVLVQA